MGFYYLDRPPEQESRWKKFLPRWLRQLWEDSREVIVMTQVVFSIVLPIFGVLIGFVLLFAGGIALLSWCAGAK